MMDLRMKLLVQATDDGREGKIPEPVGNMISGKRAGGLVRLWNNTPASASRML